MKPEDLERLCSGRNLRDWLSGQVMGRLVMTPWYIWLWRMALRPFSFAAGGIVAVLHWFVRR